MKRIHKTNELKCNTTSWYGFEDFQPRSLTIFTLSDVRETKVLRSDGEYFMLETKKEPVGFVLKSKKETTK